VLNQEKGHPSCVEESAMSEKFELIGLPQDEQSGLFHLRYGSGPDDPMPFVLTLTPYYVARALGKTPPVTYHEITNYADDNAGSLKAKAVFEKGRGRTTLILE
jgi:hypothetical protein